MMADSAKMISELRTALTGVDPVPGSVTAAALASLGYHRPEARLAELAADSALSSMAVRGGPYAPRLLTFTAPGLVIEVEITSTDDHRDLVGHLAPSRTADIEIRWPGGTRTTRADPTGHFTAPRIPHGPISMLCHPTPDTPVATTWTSI
ncbi:MAG TPA: hypothetical protein VGL93_02715 [Streptosporangiaceae bacterium]|jgi:hypothetical protein